MKPCIGLKFFLNLTDLAGLAAANGGFVYTPGFYLNLGFDPFLKYHPGSQACHICVI